MASVAIARVRHSEPTMSCRRVEARCMAAWTTFMQPTARYAAGSLAQMTFAMKQALRHGACILQPSRRAKMSRRRPADSVGRRPPATNGNALPIFVGTFAMEAKW